jgi:predicted enzyme related to lactoylglutathione lyase
MTKAAVLVLTGVAGFSVWPLEIEEDRMKRVTGIGGIFFKVQDPEKLRSWYRDHLGIESAAQGGFAFEWREADQPEKTGQTVWSLFPSDTKYFDPGSAPFMINYRVDNLDVLLAQLRSEGVKVDEKIEEYDYGRFAWVVDPEGNKIELWEPAKTQTVNP